MSRTHDTLAEVLSISQWLRGFPARSGMKPSTTTQTVRALVKPNGYAATWIEILSAIREHAQDTAPKVTASV